MHQDHCREPARAVPEDGPRLLPGLSGPTTALAGVLEAQQELLTRQARQMGLGVSDMRALRLLETRGSLGVSDLARLLDLRPASVTSLIDRLETSGHLMRVRDTVDRRRVTVQTLPETSRISLEVWEPVIRAMDDVARLLSEDQRIVVQEYLDGVHRVMTDADTVASTEDRSS